MLLDGFQSRKSAISLTPLIDVVFILLLFFMLSSTFTQTKLIDFNAASNMGSMSQQAESSRIILLPNQQALINNVSYDVTQSDFSEKLQSLAKNGDQVTVSARPKVDVQSVISLLDQLKSTGIKNLSLSETVAP